MSLLTFLIGLVIGGVVGMFVTCLCVAAGGEEDEDDECDINR